jgi:hypothetical protein
MSSTPPVAPSHVVHPLTPASGSALPVIGITASSAPFASSNAPSNQLEESTLLYHKTVPVRVQSMQRDTTSAELSISIVLRMIHSHQKSQALLFQITDEVCHIVASQFSKLFFKSTSVFWLVCAERPVLFATTGSNRV